MNTQKHLVLSYYCALQAWTRNLDGVTLDRAPLLRYLGLDRLRRERVEKLRHDFQMHFPHADQYTTSEFGEWENELHFSRVPITKELWDSGRIKSLKWPSGALTELTLLADIASTHKTDSGLSRKCDVLTIQQHHGTDLIPARVEVFYREQLVI